MKPCQPCVLDIPYYDVRLITPEDIEALGEEFFGIPIQQIKKKCRLTELVVARQIMMLAMSMHCTLSLKSIGVRFSGRDHTTVIHAKKSIKNICDVDPNYRALVKSFLNKVEEFKKL